MLRHRNVKTEEPQNQGIFIGNMNFQTLHKKIDDLKCLQNRGLKLKLYVVDLGEYEEPVGPRMKSTGSDSSSCWKKIAVILLIITGRSVKVYSSFQVGLCPSLLL